MAKRAMPKFTRPSAELTQAFDAALATVPHAERKKMFGCPAAFIGGNMFACVFQNDIVLRLDDHERAEILGMGGRAFEPMPGRVMREYVVIPPALAPEQLQQRMQHAQTYASQYPAKPKKKRTTRGKRG